MEDRLEPLLTAHPWAQTPDQNVADLDLPVAWLAQAEAALLARIHELHGQGIARRDGATSTAVWLRNRYRMALPKAHRYVRLATAIDTAPPPLRLDHPHRHRRTPHLHPTPPPRPTTNTATQPLPPTRVMTTDRKAHR